MYQVIQSSPLINPLAQEAEKTTRELTARLLNDPFPVVAPTNEFTYEVEIATPQQTGSASDNQEWFFAAAETMQDPNEEPLSGAEMIVPGEQSFSSTYNASNQPDVTDWTGEDDRKLYRLRSGGMKWSHVSREFPGRTSRACRDRYIECLRAGIEEPHKGNPRLLSQPEEDLLCELKTDDWSWSAIAELLPKRTIIACTNHWNDMQNRASGRRR